MRLLLFLSLLFLTTSTVCAQATGSPSPWRVIYAHDAEGKATEGSLADLRAAVHAGWDIKINWKRTNPKRPGESIEHTVMPEFFTILDGKHVFAQIDDIIGQAPQREKESIRLSLERRWTMVAATTGSHTMANIKQDPDDLLSTSARREFALRWLVRGG